MTSPQTEDRTRWLALYTLCASVLMIVLDATIVNVALPSIQTDLDFSNTSLAWVINAYLIPFGGLLLLAGRFGDLAGQRRVFLYGLGVFTAASLLCAVAQTQGMLIAARFIQGAGGAAASAVVLGMIVTMFPEPREQAKAIGVYGFVASAGGSIGLLLGGVLTEAISWHWIFFINVPIGAVTAYLALRLVDEKPGLGLSAGADIPGAVLCTVGLMIGVYAIIGVEEAGWVAFRTLGLMLVSIVLVAAFVVRQARIANPLMPLRLFNARTVTGANLTMMLMVAGMFAMFFLGALYLQRVLEYSPLEVGLAFLPSSALMGVISLNFTERLIMRFGASTVMLPGVAFIALGLLLFARAPADGGYWVDVFPPTMLIGVGAGITFPSVMQLSMTGVDMQDMGMASGLINSTVQVGGAIGLSVLATLSAGRAEGLTAPGAEPSAAALTSGYHVAFLVGAALVAAAFVVALTYLRPAGKAAAAQAAAAGAPTAPPQEAEYAHA